MTVVQTCALPICVEVEPVVVVQPRVPDEVCPFEDLEREFGPLQARRGGQARSEERRGGNDCSSDVCSSDLCGGGAGRSGAATRPRRGLSLRGSRTRVWPASGTPRWPSQIGRASWRE